MSFFKTSLIIFCLFFSIQPCFAQQFKDAMKEIFGKQFKNYQWLDYPLNNFGVATAYRDRKNETDPRNFLCATFTCLAITPFPNPESQFNRWLYVKRSDDTTEIGYADVGQGGEVNNSLKKKSGFQLTAFLPKVLEVVGITFDLKKDGTKDITVNSISGYSRLLNGKTVSYISGIQSDDNGLKAALRAGELVLVKGDIVITNLDITVKSTSNLKLAIDTKMLGQTAKIFGDESKFGVQITRDKDNNYSIKSTKPVIVGVLAVRQPRVLGVSPGENIPPLDKWKNFQIELPKN